MKKETKAKKNIVKKILIGLGCFLALILVILLAHPLWISPVARLAVGTIGPHLTGVDMSLGKCSVNLYSGHVEIAGFNMANPVGCREASAVRLDSLDLRFSTLSVLSDVIRVKSVEIDGVFASYEKAASGKYNLFEILDTLNDSLGLDEGEEVAQAESDAPKTPEEAKAAAEKAAAEAEKKAAEEAAEEEEGQKIAIKHISISGVVVSTLGVKMPIPPITINDIGTESDGVSLSSAGAEILSKFQGSLGSIGEGLSSLGATGLDASADAVSGAVDAVKELNLDGATDALKGAGEGLKSVGDDLKGLFK